MAQFQASVDIYMGTCARAGSGLQNLKLHIRMVVEYGP